MTDDAMIERAVTVDRAEATCTDCGAPVSGKFCSRCGQAAHPHRSLAHLGEEILHGVMHFDGRVWRTLPLLIGNPGRLTREWIAGRRSRFVSPLALFLCTIFVMFFVLSFLPRHETMTPADQTERLASQQQVLDAMRAELARTQAALAADDPGDRAEAERAISRLTPTIEALDRELETLRGQVRDGRPDGLMPGGWQAQIKDAAIASEVNGHGPVTGILKKFQNPDLAVYKLQQTIYKFAFLLVPLSIPFVWLLFWWRRGTTLYDHGVFVLYSLTFIALLLMVTVLAGTINPILGAVAGWIAVVTVPVHMFAQLKGAYGLPWVSALWRTAALLVFCAIVATAFVLTIVFLGLGH